MAFKEVIAFLTICIFILVNEILFLQLVLHEESGNRIHIGCATRFSVTLVQPYNLSSLANLLSSHLLFSLLFFFSFSNKNQYHKQADEYSLQHVIHRNELASLCHEGALDIQKYLTSDGKCPLPSSWNCCLYYSSLLPTILNQVTKSSFVFCVFKTAVVTITNGWKLLLLLMDALKNALFSYLFLSFLISSV